MKGPKLLDRQVVDLRDLDVALVELDRPADRKPTSAFAAWIRRAR